MLVQALNFIFYLNVPLLMYKGLDVNLFQFIILDMQTSGADPGFVVRGGVSRRGVWGPLKIPSGSKAGPW